MDADWTHLAIQAILYGTPHRKLMHKHTRVLDKGSVNK